MTLTKKTDRERVPNTGPKGFSLMELLVVIVIIGVIAAIGTPQLLGMRTRSSVRADARDLHSTYRQAQTEAVKRSFDACVKSMMLQALIRFELRIILIFLRNSFGQEILLI